MKTKHLSAIFSLILATVLLAGILAVACVLPLLTESYLNLSGRWLEPAEHGLSDFQKILVLLYTILLPALIADLALLRLLVSARREQVFEPRSIRCISIISWCCIGETALFALLSFYFPFSLLIAFAALFVGLCLRVVRHVLETAADLKKENDLTV